MGRKHKHSKDKLYKTVSELTSHHIGESRDIELSALHRRLKFNTCCLSLNAISKKPVGLCDQDGFCYVFECDLVVRFLEKFQVHPVTGMKVSAKDLIELNFHKNDEDQYHCPVIYKLFNQNSKIIANRKTGHVYSYDAYQQLNLRPNNFKDLLTDEPFEKTDMVLIQDPATAETKWNVSEFYHVKKKLKIEENDESNVRAIEKSTILKTTLDEYKGKSEEIVRTFNRIVGQGDSSAANDSTKLDKINSAVYSDGKLSSSVTSTIVPVVTGQRAATLSEESVLYPRIKKKAYVQLVTNFGPLNLELYCDKVPKTCHNFLLLLTKGYYDGTIFHRLIKNFILQGGDPTGTGSGGQSAWGEPFSDECRADLKHEGRGVLSMANSGLNTNKSQFYITLRGVWDHLDGKHTVFGRVVGGLETLDRIESEVETDDKDRPKKDIKIVKTVKYVDPYEEAQEEIERERRQEEEKKRPTTTHGSGQPLKRFRSGVGAYIDLDQFHQRSARSSQAPNRDFHQQKLDETTTNGCQKMTTGLASRLSTLGSTQKTKKSSFGDFSNW